MTLPVDLPKVVLHDHLDGGLRPETVIELADALPYGGLPASDASGLAAWFHQSGSGSLERYLEAFAQTVAVMQTPEALERVAYEAVVDLAADGVVYGELRFAPGLHTERGLGLHRVIDAVLSGAAMGEEATGVTARIIVDALRNLEDSDEVAEAAVHHAGRGVVGFDLAGPEAGFPASSHLAACRAAIAGGLHLTLHAGEGDGPAGITDAVRVCGAERIGHGVRVAEDLEIVDGEVVALGPVASMVRDEAIPLEVCPSSNIDTGIYPSIADHPLGALHRGGFVVTLNTDNRLMTATSMGREFELAAEHHGFSIGDLRRVTLNAVDAAFCDESIRSSIRERVLAGYDSV